MRVFFYILYALLSSKLWYRKIKEKPFSENTDTCLLLVYNINYRKHRHCLTPFSYRGMKYISVSRVSACPYSWFLFVGFWLCLQSEVHYNSNIKVLNDFHPQNNPSLSLYCYGHQLSLNCFVSSTEMYLKWQVVHNYYIFHNKNFY